MDSAPSKLFQGIVGGAPLIDELPGSRVFDPKLLGDGQVAEPLNMNQKLGHLVEDAVACLIEASDRFDLVHRNLQLQPDPQTTLGELDFVLRDLQSGHFIHLELAAKFYLALPTPDGIRLPGPDPADNYFTKLGRLRDHQLRLTQLHRDHLPELIRSEPIEVQHLILGILFDPADAKDPFQPDFIHPSCRRGRWVHVDALEAFFEPDARFELVPKPLWPVPLEFLRDVPLRSWNRREMNYRCVMLRVNQGVEPWFVVPAHFPESR